MKKILISTFFTLLSFALLAQEITIKGRVLDENNVPLPGVTVLVEGTSTGTTTSTDGTFSISINKSATGAILFSFMGYGKQRLELVEGKTYYEIALKPETTEMEEVIVIGYGTQRKKDVSVSISTVKAEAVSSPAILSLDQSLQGQAAGVVVSQSTGKPGAPVSIRIRGTSSINGNNEPLYVIDGLPIITNASDLTSGTIQGSDINPLSGINPNDIESIQILKDASATAIYGARGANGVILITTKQGFKGQMQVSISSSLGFQQLSKKLEVLNARQLAELGNAAVWEARKYYPDLAYNSAFAIPSRFGEGTDWQNQIFRTASLTNQQISVRGGGENSTYYMSANLAMQNGIIKNSDFGKGTFRVNLDNRISKSVKSGISINISRSINNGVTTGVPNVASSVTAMALLFNPGQDVYDPSDESGYTYESNTLSRIPNPVAEINETKTKITTSRVIADYYTDWNITSDLQYKLKAGVDAFFNDEQQFIPSYIKRGQGKGKGSNVGINGYTWLVENTFTYMKDFNKHHLNLMVGQTAQKYVSESADIAVERFEDNRLGYYNLGLALDKTINTSYTTWAMLSGIGRLMYNYESKYYLTLSGRVDGSSKFGTSNKYGFFPSASMAWRVTGEPFMESIEAVNDLKLRFSAGTVGNEGIPSGSSLSLLANRPYFFGEGTNAEVIGTYVYSLENVDLKWEVTTQYDAGMDLSLWQSRVEFIAEAYLKQTSDLLLYMPINTSSGFSYVWANVGDLSNKGMEFTLNTVNLKNEVKWSTAFNLSFNRNKVTNIDKSDKIYGNPIMNIIDWTMISEGEPIGTIYGYKSDGIIQLDEDPSQIPFFVSKIPRYGDRKYIDKNGDGKLTTEDYFKLGNTNPDFSFGLKNSFAYKNFTLSLYIQGDVGNSVVNFNLFQLESFDGAQNNLKVALERWTETNPSNKYPRANASPHGNVMSDVIVEDGSYIRLKEATLTYQFPKKIFAKTQLKDLQLSISGRNLLTLTGYSGYDPEVSIFGGSVYGKGADYGAYPQSISVIFSISATF